MLGKHGLGKTCQWRTSNSCAFNVLSLAPQSATSQNGAPIAQQRARGSRDDALIHWRVQGIFRGSIAMSYVEQNMAVGFPGVGGSLSAQCCWVEIAVKWMQGSIQKKMDHAVKPPVTWERFLDLHFAVVALPSYLY